MFKKIGSLDPHGAPVLRRAVIQNSAETTQLDAVKLASGVVAPAATGDAVLGHLMAHKNDRGTGLLTSGTTGAAVGSYNETFTAASNNETVEQVVAEVDISKFTLYSASLDVAVGTTTGSDLAGYKMDLADETELDESTAAVTAAQYFSWGLDPEDTAKVVVQIYESQVFGA